MPEEKFPGVFLIGGKLATRSLAPGQRVYGERLASEGGAEYRLWDPYRSKLAGAIVKGLKVLPVMPGAKVLYLGAASGTTVSHVSDIVGNDGMVYAVEFAPRVMRDLLSVCEPRPNTLPVMADARTPEAYEKYIKGKVDVIYEDVADPAQARILLVNARTFLKKGGSALMAIKSQSIDVSKKPQEVYRHVLEELAGSFDCIESFDTDPFDKLHLFVSLKFKG